MFFTKKKKRTVENESWFYHIFRKNSVLVHAKTTTSYDTVENALTEGIGQGRVTKNLEGFTPDYNYEIDDTAALNACYELISKEGLSLGMSSGINVAGAERLAQELGPGHTLVTILCDSASRYQGKMFNRSFLKEKGLPEPEWLEPALPDDVAAALDRAKVQVEE